MNTIEKSILTQSGLILLLTNRELPWVTNSLESFGEVLTMNDFQQIAKMLNNIRCDLLIIDAATVKDQTLSAVKELKRNFPHFPVGVLLEKMEDPMESLVTAGADLILAPMLSTEELQQQVRIVLRQNTYRRAIVTRSEKLYMVSSLPTLLRDVVDTKQILLQAVKIIINFLNLAAVTIVISDGHLYTSSTVRKPLVTANLFIDDVDPNDEDNPILWSIRYRRVQVYDNISLNPHFVLSEGANEYGPAIIVPFTYPSDQHGAIAFFLPQKSLIVNQDIFIYEQFVVQLESILLRAYQNELQTRQLSLSKRLVEAWSIFAKPQDFDEALHLLGSFIRDINGVKNILIYCQNPQTREELLLDNSKGDLIHSLDRLELQLILKDVQSSIKTTSQATVIDMQELDSNQANPLTKIFAANQFVLMPIVISNDTLGLVTIAIAKNYRLDALDVYLLENITQIAINALQSITLRNIVARNQMELMSIIYSIREGIFYVGEDQKVTFCNPQLTELTSVAVGDRVNQDVDGLLQAIAMVSHSPTHVYSQLQTARQQVTVSDGDHDYPIVMVPLAEQNIELSIEFVGIDQNSDKSTWMGVVHQGGRLQGASASVLEPLVGHMRVAHMRLRSAIETLEEKHGHYSHNEHSELLEKIRINATIASKHWEQFDNSYSDYFAGISLRPESINVNNLLERALKDDGLSREQTQLKIELLSPEATIKVDEFHFSRALSELFTHLVEVAPPDDPIEVKVEEQNGVVNIIVTNNHSLKVFAVIEEILARTTYLPTETQSGFELVSAVEFINRSGAQIVVQRSDNITKFLRISLPVVSLTVQQLDEHERQGLLEEARLGETANSVPRREALSIMIVEGQSALSTRLINLLEIEGFSLYRYKTGEDAVVNAMTNPIDLIILDLNLEDENSLTVCQRIRKLTTVPILMIADHANAQEKARCIQMGVDDLVTAATPDRELIATVHAILNHRSSPTSRNDISLGDLYMDFSRRAVFLRNEPIDLTPIEYDVLYCLIINRGQTVTHRQLLTQVWGSGYENESQYLWVSISRLRKKLEVIPGGPRYIRTQSGIGYYFAV